MPSEARHKLRHESFWSLRERNIHLKSWEGFTPASRVQALSASLDSAPTLFCDYGHIIFSFLWVKCKVNMMIFYPLRTKAEQAPARYLILAIIVGERLARFCNVCCHAVQRMPTGPQHWKGRLIQGRGVNGWGGQRTDGKHIVWNREGTGFRRHWQERRSIALSPPKAFRAKRYGEDKHTVDHCEERAAWEAMSREESPILLGGGDKSSMRNCCKQKRCVTGPDP